MLSLTKKKPCLYFVLLVLAFYAGLTFANLGDRKIGLKAARVLVHEVLKKHAPSADLIFSPRKDDPDFYFFAATWPNPVGSPVIGYYAVNPATGDVWDIGCRRLTTPLLRKRQNEIHRQFGFSEKEYRVLRDKKPIC